MAENWMIYGEDRSLARNYVEAEQQRVNLLVRKGENGYTLVIEMGMESVSVVLKSSRLEDACQEAEQFARGYFHDKAKLWEEIADRL